MTGLHIFFLVYLAGVAAVTLYRLPGNMRRAAEHVANGHSSSDVLPVFIVLVCAIAGGIFWPWNLLMWARWRLAVRRRALSNAKLMAMLREALDKPLPPIVSCKNVEHHRGNSCPRCGCMAYCDDCASCESCQFEAPWANNFDPWYATRFPHDAPPAEHMCGFCGGVTVHTRFCSATRKAVYRSVVTLTAKESDT